jgi:hypothetical protein
MVIIDFIRAGLKAAPYADLLAGAAKEAAKGKSLSEAKKLSKAFKTAKCLLEGGTKANTDAPCHHERF